MVLSKLSSRDFRLLRENKSFKYKTKNFLFVYNFVNNSIPVTISYGSTVTKKKLKKAVHRNRIKRLIRESFRKVIKHRIFENTINVNLVFIASDPLQTVDSIKDKDVYKEVENFISKVNQTNC